MKTIQAAFQDSRMILGYLSVPVHSEPKGTDLLTEIYLYSLTSISVHTSWLMSAMFNSYLPYHMYTQTEGSSSEINQALNSCQLMRKIGHEKFRKHSICDTNVWFWKVCQFISLTESLKECCCWFKTFHIIIVRHAHSYTSQHTLNFVGRLPLSTQVLHVDWHET